MPATSDMERVPSTPAGANAVFAARFAKKGEFVSRRIAAETLLVPVRGHIGDLDSIYSLSEVASLIWNGIDGQMTVQQLVEGVCAEFDVPPETAQSDTLQFLTELQRAGLIEPRLETED